MEESVLATFNEVNFIEGETFLTQQNWQEYFSPVVKSGVYKGLEQHNYVGSTVYTNGRRLITDGTVFADGISAKITTAEGYTDIGTVPSSSYDRFVCVRVYFDTNQAQIIQKTGITEPNSNGDYYPNFVNTVMNFINNESYCCERNSSFWDIPLFVQCEQGTGRYGEEGIDLRRMMNYIPSYNPLNQNGIYTVSTDKTIVSGSNTYSIFTSSNHMFYMDPINKPRNAIIRVKNTGSSAITVKFSMSYYINDHFADKLNNNLYRYGRVNYINSQSIFPYEQYSGTIYNSYRTYSISGSSITSANKLFHISYVGEYDTPGYDGYHIDVITPYDV